ncbi:MAG: serine/threonine-protein phosphatase [Gammaproteobacteria bacterium]|nr:serine/threonine-protein phosphatase [Gammaproteobacteria bacterium]
MNNQELTEAAEIHYGFLPENYLDDNIDIAITVKPHGYVGGDYCSVIPLPSDNVFVCMCDVAGHGISSALFAARINAFVAAQTHISLCPCELTIRLNALVCEHILSARILTTFYTAIFNFKTHQVSYVGAGHPPMLHYQNRTQQINQLASTTTPIGIEHPLPIQCQTGQLTFESGDQFFLYTDGVHESRNADKEQFGLTRLSEFILANTHLSTHEYNAALLKELTGFGGDEFDDDLLLMSMHIRV